jgi:hypothetical protein
VPYRTGLALGVCVNDRIRAGCSERGATSGRPTLVSVITMQDLMFQSQRLVNIW